MKRATAIRALAFVAVVVAGCAQATGFPPASQLKEGLNIFSADEIAGLSGALVRDGRVVYFETRRGQATPEIYRMTPDAPQYEIDVRYLDKDGSPFFTQMGGDRFIDSTWNIVKAPVSTLDPIKGRTAEFQLAREIAPMLKSRSLAGSVVHEVNAMGIHAQGFTDSALFQPAIAAVKSAEDGTSPYTTYYKDQVQVAHECLATCLAQHSATQATILNSSGATVAQSYSCNHGHCYGSLSNDCTWTSALNRTSPTLNTYQQETAQDPNSNYGGCSTGYNWTSVLGTHNCNDDSELQVNDIINNKTYSTNSGNVCNDNNIHATHPNCASTM